LTVTSDSPERRPGRPVDPAKRAAILKAGKEAFMRDGYAVSMDRIAEEAGVSKQTIYKHFSSKEALFLEIIQERATAMRAPMRDHPADEPVAQTLQRLGVSYIELLLMPDLGCVHRLLASEGGRCPHVISEFLRVGPETSVTTLSDFLVEQQAKGRLAVPEPRLAAEQFFGLVGGHLNLRATLGVQPRWNAEQIAQRAAKAVEVFLAAYGAKS
jgi:TetR/AcrR family transcriptional repressor of mexJK operon